VKTYKILFGKKGDRYPQSLIYVEAESFKDAFRAAQSHVKIDECVERNITEIMCIEELES
jgi:hypothetical protein